MGKISPTSPDRPDLDTRGGRHLAPTLLDARFEDNGQHAHGGGRDSDAHRGARRTAMIFEHATISIASGRETEFESAFTAEGPPLFDRAQGCHGVELRRCIEDPGRYTLIVRWDSVEAHIVGFRESPLFGQWRALVSDYFAAAPVVEHYSVVGWPASARTADVARDP